MNESTKICARPHVGGVVCRGAKTGYPASRSAAVHRPGSRRPRPKRWRRSPWPCDVPRRGNWPPIIAHKSVKTDVSVFFSYVYGRGRVLLLFNRVWITERTFSAAPVRLRSRAQVKNQGCEAEIHILPATIKLSRFRRLRRPRHWSFTLLNVADCQRKASGM